jgi:ABC-type uncharacterized transport system permease subunit
VRGKPVTNLLSFLTSPVVEGFLSASMRLAVPIMLAALGGIFNERAGVLNIGMEGMMLTGCLVGFAVGALSNNMWLGVLAASLAGLVLGLVLGFFIITLPANQVVAGIALNLLAVGLTSFMYRVVFGTNTQAPRVSGFSTIIVPGLSQIAILGPLLFQQEPLVYLAFALAAITWVVIFHSAWGLQVQAVGEHPEAAETLGVNVARTRYICLAISGFMCGIGGAYLSLGATHIFLDNMTAGRGYIALAILILGQRHPAWLLGAALLFGAADALQLRAQLLGIGVPFQFLLMLPYVLTMIVLAGFVRRTDAPAALGVTYQRGQSGKDA